MVLVRVEEFAGNFALDHINEVTSLVWRDGSRVARVYYPGSFWGRK